MSLGCDATGVEIVDEWFEEGVLRLETALPGDLRLRCCVTCLYSDYSPEGHGLIGMFCHRGAKERYLTVSSKAEYWGVPVAEEVVETYLCESTFAVCLGLAIGVEPPDNPAEYCSNNRPDPAPIERRETPLVSSCRQVFVECNALVGRDPAA